MVYPKLCEIKIVDLFKTNNFAFLRFFRISHIIVKKIEFRIFNSIFLNYKEKYTSYEKKFPFKFVDLHVENNFL